MHGEWEVSERHGRAWQMLVGATMILAIAVPGWSARGGEVELTVRHDAPPAAEPAPVLRQPVRAGHGWVCGDRQPVRAFASGRYYPPEHPAPPDPAVRPEGCFVTARAAAWAGYESAPAPADAVAAGSLYLVAAVAPSARACRDVAAVVDFAVPCPRRLPVPGRAASCRNSCLFYGRAARPGAVIEQRGVALPTDWCPDCEGQLVVTATKDRSPPELIACGPSMAVAAEAGEPIAGYHDCGPGPRWLPGIAGYPHEGHTLLVWEVGRMAYAVSMEGEDDARVRAVLAAVRDHIELVGPPGR